MTTNETVLPRRLNQINQTKQDLMSALLQLLAVRKLKTLTVTEVCQRAGYARRTFYRHFDDLTAVLAAVTDQLTTELYATIKTQQTTKFAEMVVVFFDFWQQHQNFLNILRDNHCLPLLEDSWINNIDQSSLAKLPGPNQNYAESFGIGGMFALLIQWIANHYQQSPAEMGTIAQKITAHLVH